jgi:hypothetical protein
LPTLATQPAVDVAAGLDGVVHILWQQTTVGVGELHYQRRRPVGKPSPLDTTLTSSSQTIQNPAIATDLQGGVHVAFERITPPAQQVRYLLWRPDRGWDSGATDITDPSGSSTALIGLAAITFGNVNLALTDYDGNGYHARYRRRRLDGPAALDVPAAPPARRAAFRLWPNPARAGAEFVLSGTELGTDRDVELFDDAGRRVAATTSHGDRARFAPAATRALQPGLYFARVRGGGSARLVVLR